MRRRINRRATMASKANLPPRSLSCCARPVPPRHALTHPFPQSSLEHPPFSYCTPLIIPRLLIRDSRNFSGNSVECWEWPLRVSVERRGLNLVLCGVSLRGGSLRSMRPIWSPWSPTAWRVASLHAIHAPPRGTLKHPFPTFCRASLMKKESTSGAYHCMP
jgi:hypothetical protein